MKKILIVLLCICLMFSLTGCEDIETVVDFLSALPTFEPSPTPTQEATEVATLAPSGATTDTPAPSLGELAVYVIDVGQGDSILLISPSSKTMLIDAGDGDSYGAIRSQLKKLNISSLDVVVATHPHADHIGSMDEVINNYPIGSFYMTDFVATTRTFENMLSALETKEVSVHQALSGLEIPWDENVTVTVLSPLEGVEYDDSNASSIVLKVDYGQSSIVLTGDAEKETEEGIIAHWGEAALKANVLKLGHHGSSSSSCLAFVVAVDPDFTVCSLGADNSYGHPHRETLDLMDDLNLTMHRTDLEGTIKIVLDGVGARVVE